jgi:hypothetical protein
MFLALSMASEPDNTVEDLNSKNDFKYLYYLQGEIISEIYAVIAKPDPLQPIPQHRIRGSLNEIHCLYLAIENVLRIEQYVDLKRDIFRTASNFEDDLYPIIIPPKSNDFTTVLKPENLPRFHHNSDSKLLPYFHRDQELDFSDEDSDEDEDSDGDEDSVRAKIRKRIRETKSGFYEYFKTFQSSYTMSISIGYIPEITVDKLQHIRVITKYANSSGNEIVRRSTDVKYTLRELIVLRAVLWDFLIHKFPITVDWFIDRRGALENYRIESLIRYPLTRYNLKK